MRWIRMAALGAAFVFLIPASGEAGWSNNTLGIKGWWVPQTTISGFEMRVVGDRVEITPTTERLQGGAAGTIMLSTVIADTFQIGTRPQCRVPACSLVGGVGSDFTFPTDRKGSAMILSHFISSVMNRDLGKLLDYSELPPVVFSRQSGRQPRLTLGPSRPPDYVNAVEAASRADPPPTLAQLEALRRLVQEKNEPLVPGRVFVTVLLKWDKNKFKFVVDKAVYKFEADWNGLLADLKVDSCPPGWTGTPPDCQPPAPPPAPGPTCPGDLIGKYPDCYPPPAGCPSCGPIDPEGKVELFR